MVRSPFVLSASSANVRVGPNNTGVRESTRSSVLSRLIRQNAQWLAIEFRRIATQLEEAVPGPPVFAFPIVFVTQGGKRYMSDIQVPADSGPLTGTLAFQDSKGNSTTAAGVPVWTSSDESVATVEASEDGLTATVTVTGNAGASQITATDDEATSDTEDDVIAVGTVSVVPGKAVVGNIEFSAS